jgi:hypothetical protein
MGREDDIAADAADDTSDAQESKTPPSDDLSFDEAIAEQEDAEQPDPGLVQ